MRWREYTTIKKLTIIAPFLLGACAFTGPALAQDRDITCEVVRAYVARVGLEQARTVAVAHGMTAAQEQKARACLFLEDSSQSGGEAQRNLLSATAPRATPATVSEEAQAN